MIHPTAPSKFGHSTPHSPDMQHRLLFKWPPFNTLSLGATSLYRRVMAPSLLKVFDEKPTPVKTIEVEVEDKLYHVPELASCRTFDKFDSAFPDLPPKHLHLPSQKVEFLAGDCLEVTGDSAASKVCFDLNKPSFRNVYVVRILDLGCNYGPLMPTQSH